MVPLNENELRKIKIEKAAKKKKGQTESDVCSICCDEIVESTKVRRMPECKHMFH
jgi:hypothetical protein